MGYALAYDLARSDATTSVTLADLDLERAKDAAARIPHGSVIPAQVDVRDEAAVVRLMRHHDGAASAVSFRFNELLTRAAIAARCHLVDLGGNDDVVAAQRRLHEDARRAGIAVVPNCGLAPGLVNILAMGSLAEFESVDTVALRVGGLPQHPRPPLNYQLTFSVEGLLNEYSGKADVIRNGKRIAVEALTEIESIEFPDPFGAMEAFITTGGASLLPELLEGKVRTLDYKTIRYPGHCQRIKELLDLGFGSNEPVQMGSNIFTEREVFAELLRRKLPNSGPDVVLLRATITGSKLGGFSNLSYQAVDFFDGTANITSMMRMTSFPTSIILQFLALDVIEEVGVLAPEQSVPLNPMLTALDARGIHIDRTMQLVSGR